MERETERDGEHNVTVRLFLKVNIKMLHTHNSKRRIVSKIEIGTQQTISKRERKSHKNMHIHEHRRRNTGT